MICGDWFGGGEFICGDGYASVTPVITTPHPQIPFSGYAPALKNKTSKNYLYKYFHHTFDMCNGWNGKAAQKGQKCLTVLILYKLQLYKKAFWGGAYHFIST